MVNSFDGRRFRSIENSASGQVTAATEFVFGHDGDVVFARYSGGAIRLGFLIGTLDGGRLKFRYAHVDRDGALRSGESDDRVEELPDGRLRLHERWRWHGDEGSGTSVLEEVAADGGVGC